jgi:predicted nucleic acid-binding protein
MPYLVDTSILARLANTADANYSVAVRAVLALHQQGDTLRITAQNLIEFRNLATRPTAVNGLGLSTAEAETKAAVFEAAFPLLVETPEIFLRWKALVGALGITGKRVHDARLAAVCHAHSVTHLLTFNVPHFTGMAGFGPGFAAVDPATV